MVFINENSLILLPHQFELEMQHFWCLQSNRFHVCNATIFLHFSRRVIIKIIICFWLNSVGYFTLDLQMGSDDSSVMSQLVFDWLSWNHLKGFSCSVFKIFEFFGLLRSSKSSRYSKSSRSRRSSDFGTIRQFVRI